MSTHDEHREARRAASRRALGIGDVAYPESDPTSGVSDYGMQQQHHPAYPESKASPAPNLGESWVPTETPQPTEAEGDTGTLFDYQKVKMDEIRRKLNIPPSDDTGGSDDTGRSDDTGDPRDTGDYDTGGSDDTGGSPSLPDWLADLHNYQNEFIYKIDPEGDGPSGTELASDELWERLNDPEGMRTLESSEYPDWKGTGHILHEVIGEDMTRFFLVDPSTGDVTHITGHPKAEER